MGPGDSRVGNGKVLETFTGKPFAVSSFFLMIGSGCENHRPRIRPSEPVGTFFDRNNLPS